MIRRELPNNVYNELEGAIRRVKAVLFKQIQYLYAINAVFFIVYLRV